MSVLLTGWSWHPAEPSPGLMHGKCCQEMERNRGLLPYYLGTREQMAGKDAEIVFPP